MKNPFCILLLTVFWTNFLFAQSRTDLEGKRQSINQEIDKTSQKLSKAASEKKVVLQKLSSLQQQLSSREELVGVLSQNVDLLNNLIDSKISVVESMETDLDKLKDNYKKIVRVLYRHKVNQNLVAFLFSADSFNEGYQRWIYVQHLEKYRSAQAKLIKKVQQDLSNCINVLENRKSEKDTLLQQELGQKHLISKELMDKGKAMNQLKKQESTLLSDLNRKQRYKKQLDKNIEAAIHKQIAAAKEAARQYQKKLEAAAKEKEKQPNAQENISPILKTINPANATTQAFAQQKGKLISPIYQGEVIGFFGKRSHPVFKDVFIDNTGIDIKGWYNSVVLNVYQGEVVSVFTIPGMNNAVMIKHGNYYTTYSNIAQVYVKRGDVLKAGGQIGTIGRDNNSGGHLLHFELWHNKTKQNPSDWIK